MKHTRMKRTGLGIGRRRAILVAVITRDNEEDVLKEGRPCGELSLLVETAGAEPVATVVQKLRTPDKTFYVGRGKVDEIKTVAKAQEAKVVVFDNELSPAQQRNLEEKLGIAVLDRTEIILSIFGQRARSKQAKAQVELAHLEYTLPRLRRMWTHLERQTGGIGVRGGMGERQIEVDRRKVRKRIRDLSDEIKRGEKRRQRQVAARFDNFRVSLVGYTNAGKSSLLNVLTGADVFVEDRLFATLDSRTRELALGGGRKALLSDTVGFIRRLPHRLVASFHATLEEVLTADLLLHVVDAGEEEPQLQIEAVNSVLEEIGALEKPTIMVLNKVDMLEDTAPLRALAVRYNNPVMTSAKTGEGLEDLKERVFNASLAKAERVHLKVPAAEGGAFAFLSEQAVVLSHDSDDCDIVMEVMIGPGQLSKLLGEHPGVSRVV